jgi:hypothetical protein
VEVIKVQLRHVVASTKGFGPEKDCTGKGQQHIHKTDPSSRQRERPTKTRNNYQGVINLGLDTKTYLLTDLQSQCDFDLEK